MATHSGILAWRIPWKTRLVGYISPWGRKESDRTEQLHSLTHSLKVCLPQIIFYILTWVRCFSYLVIFVTCLDIVITLDLKKKISKVYSDKSVQNKNEAVFVKVKLIHKFSYYEFEIDIFVKTSSSSHCFLM